LGVKCDVILGFGVSRAIEQRNAGRAFAPDIRKLRLRSTTIASVFIRGYAVLTWQATEVVRRREDSITDVLMRLLISKLQLQAAPEYCNGFA
jgi:hypothetical protein